MKARTGGWSGRSEGEHNMQQAEQQEPSVRQVRQFLKGHNLKQINQISTHDSSFYWVRSLQLIIIYIYQQQLSRVSDGDLFHSHLQTPGFEPRTFHIQSIHSTSELRSLPKIPSDTFLATYLKTIFKFLAVQYSQYFPTTIYLRKAWGKVFKFQVQASKSKN